jgi:hypothetical protein
MAAPNTTSGAATFTFTGEEQAQLLSILEQALRNKEIEEHRTDALAFKAFVQHEEAVLRSLVDKVRRPC